MGAFDGETLADRFRNHFGHTDHLYGALLAEMADDWEVGGVTREIFDGWEDAPARQFPQLRMLAGLFRDRAARRRARSSRASTRRSAATSTTTRPGRWCAPCSARTPRSCTQSLREAPQTNEPARTVALLVGLAEAVRRTGLRRVRLLEPGASAGLGPARRPLPLRGGRLGGRARRTSPLVVEGCGAAGFVPAAVEVVDRRGCDVAPVDAATDEGAIYLTSFVWPWQLDRHARLAAALRGGARAPGGRSTGLPASTWVAQRLADPVDDDVLTVVWHSVTRLYWPAEETAAMTAAVDEARGRIPVVHVAMEHHWAAAPARATRACRCSPSTTTSSPPATTTGRPVLLLFLRAAIAALAGALRTLSR